MSSRKKSKKNIFFKDDEVRMAKNIEMREVQRFSKNSQQIKDFVFALHQLELNRFISYEESLLVSYDEENTFAEVEKTIEEWFPPNRNIQKNEEIDFDAIPISRCYAYYSLENNLHLTFSLTKKPDRNNAQLKIDNVALNKPEASLALKESEANVNMAEENEYIDVENQGNEQLTLKTPQSFNTDTNAQVGKEEKKKRKSDEIDQSRSKRLKTKKTSEKSM